MTDSAWRGCTRVQERVRRVYKRCHVGWGVCARGTVQAREGCEGMCKRSHISWSGCARVHEGLWVERHEHRGIGGGCASGADLSQ